MAPQETTTTTTTTTDGNFVHCLPDICSGAPQWCEPSLLFSLFANSWDQTVRQYRSKEPGAGGTEHQGLPCKKAASTSAWPSAQSSQNGSFKNRKGWGETPSCAAGCWASWPGDHRQCELAGTHVVTPHWTHAGASQGRVLSPFLFTFATRWHTAPTSSSLMRRLWWVWSATMRQMTGVGAPGPVVQQQ